MLSVRQHQACNDCATKRSQTPCRWLLFLECWFSPLLMGLTADFVVRRCRGAVTAEYSSRLVLSRYINGRPTGQAERSDADSRQHWTSDDCFPSDSSNMTVR